MDILIWNKMEKVTVIKVGGKIVEEEATLYKLLDDFAAIEGYKVLVHGGGRSATKLAAQLGIESKMVNGRRITDTETLKVVTMVYGGLRIRISPSGFAAWCQCTGLDGSRYGCNPSQSNRKRIMASGRCEAGE